MPSQWRAFLEENHFLETHVDTNGRNDWQLIYSFRCNTVDVENISAVIHVGASHVDFEIYIFLDFDGTLYIHIKAVVVR